MFGKPNVKALKRLNTSLSDVIRPVVEAFVDAKMERTDISVPLYQVSSVDGGSDALRAGGGSVIDDGPQIARTSSPALSSSRTSAWDYRSWLRICCCPRVPARAAKRKPQNARPSVQRARPRIDTKTKHTLGTFPGVISSFTAASSGPALFRIDVINVPLAS
jgi:hypothetical protein